MPAPLRLDIEPHQTPAMRKIARAVELLHDGAVAAYPTDTVYALGCVIESRRGTERIYQAKRMDENQRLALICPDLSTASQYARFTDRAYRLAKRILPGPYTLVLPATTEVPRLHQTKKRRRVGIRIPDHPVTLALVQTLGRPLLTSSAIPPGGDEALGDPDEVLEHFGRAIDLLIDSGPIGTEPSTVIAIEDDEIVIVREGRGSLEGLVAD